MAVTDGNSGAAGRRVVLHVGPHKTGTTYLQANFARQAEQLRQRGWLYPVIGERVGIAHHDFSDSRRQFMAGEGAVVDDFRRVVAQADAQGLNLLLSSEGFQSWRPQHFHSLQRHLGERTLHIVYVLRDPLDKFYSMWAQVVKSGLTQSLPERMEEHFGDPESSKLLNPLIEIQPVFEDPRLDYTVLLYDELGRRGQDLYGFFLQEILGIRDLGVPKAQAINERLPIEMTEFMRVLSSESGRARGREQREALHIGDVMSFLFSARERADILSAMQQHAAPARHVLELPRDTPDYLALQARLVALLGAHMRPAPAGDALFPHEPARWAYYDADELRAIPQVRAELDKALRKLRPDNPRLVVANAVKRLLLRWRGLRKRIRLGGGSVKAAAPPTANEKRAQRQKRRAGRGR